ncbi:glycosyltransferase [Dokdonella sp.]|uniref:glycosyltransferase n=1 Tax=Dokdonella sp. TaxID=2291710 RepID=UPI001AFFB51D|nr:glycosyltransferase [Dokdonella sp.]MBO9661980.1 glycosyltransferase [Dokdonella sp.]
MESARPTVSIVVPAFNAQERLGACLDSLLAQSLGGIEIIVVDDGSTDGTAALCERYAGAHANLVHLRQANGGCSKARNAGLARARGEFVGFCDADDFAEPPMFERLYAAAKEHAADVAVCRYFIGAGRERSHSNIEGFAAGVHRREAIVQHWLKPLAGLGDASSVHGFVWTCLFRRELLERQTVRFSEAVSMHEDALFIMASLAHAERLAYVDEALYHYVHSPSSLTSQYFAKREVPRERRIAEQAMYFLLATEIASDEELKRTAPALAAHSFATWLYYASSRAAIAGDESAERPRRAISGLLSVPPPLPYAQALRCAELAPFKRVFLALAAVRASALIHLLCRLRPPRIY